MVSSLPQVPSTKTMLFFFLFNLLSLFLCLFKCKLNVGVKLKEAGQSAGTFVGGVTKDAKTNVSDVAERVGTMFKSRWALLQQPSTRHAVQDRLISAAATTGTLLRRGLSGTKDKVTVGKTKVEEVIYLNDGFFYIDGHNDFFLLNE